MSPAQLWSALLSFAGPQWSVGGILRLLTDGTGFVAPLALSAIVTYVQELGDEPEVWKKRQTK